MPLHVGHQHSQFWPILARFMDYYSLFWGPGLISTVDEPRDAFTCRSSTLAVLAESDPFRGLLLIVLGSRSVFHDLRTPGCVYVSVINTRSFGRFWPVSWTIYSLFWGPRVISTINEPRGAFTFRSSTLTVLADSGPFRGLFTHCFWGPGVISTINEPRGAFTCRSSTLAVLADAGPFHGLFTHFSGPWSDFHD